jgi:hypothetical protein
LPLLGGGAAAMVVGVATGLQRLGWNSLGDIATVAELHGTFMVCGFLGTVIAIERAVALGWVWAYLAPLASVVATVAILAGLPVAYAQAGWLVSGAVLFAASAAIAARHPAPFTVLLALGAGAWPVGTLAWALGSPMPAVVLWWMSFLVLTIAAERLELNRVFPPTVLSQWLFHLPIVLLLLAAIGAALDSSAAWRAAGVALLGIAAWLFRHDVARRTIWMSALPRYAAACLLSGYAWLALAGAMLAALPVESDRLAYDAALHAVFLGFVFAMVFGHAPIILPAVTGVAVPFSRVLYGPLVILNLSVGARVAGDLLADLAVRRWSGVLSACAIALFIVTMLALASRGRPGPGRKACSGTKTDPAGDAMVAP